MTEEKDLRGSVPEDVLQDPAVRKALAKAARKSSHKRRGERQKPETDPSTGEKIVVRAGDAGMAPRQLRKAEKRALRAAKAVRQAEDKLVQRTFYDLTELRFVVRNLQAPGYGHFQLADNSHMEILGTRGRNLLNAMDSEIEITQGLFMEFIRRCTQDIKLIGVNTPLNTKHYQQELQELMRGTDNPAYLEMLQENIEQFQQMDQQTIQRQLFIAVYGKTAEELVKVKRSLFASPIHVYEMTLNEQQQVLKKENNLPYPILI